MRVEVNRDLCVGSGQCVVIASSVFDQDDDSGTVVLLNDTPPESMGDEIAEAVEICPARAIAIVEG
jgi:ferredoxin